MCEVYPSCEQRVRTSSMVSWFARFKKVLKLELDSDVMPPMPIIIPVWFYGFDSVMYFICSMVGFLLSFYFHKIYSLSSEKKHMYLYFGFLLLSFGLLSLSITSTYSYTTFWQCRSRPCVLGMLDQAFGLEDFAYLLYFGLSILAYTLFMLAYIPKNFKIPNLPLYVFLIFFFIIFITLPIENGEVDWSSYNGFFNLAAFLMMIFISFMSIANFSENKSLNPFLVTTAFILLSLFHLLHLFSFVNGLVYVLAHIAMLISFTLLLSVVIGIVKVKNK